MPFDTCNLARVIPDLGLKEVPQRLQVEPGLRIQPEELLKPERSIWSYAPLPVDDFIQSWVRFAEALSEPRVVDPRGFTKSSSNISPGGVERWITRCVSPTHRCVDALRFGPLRPLPVNRGSRQSSRGYACIRPPESVQFQPALTCIAPLFGRQAEIRTVYAARHRAGTDVRPKICAWLRDVFWVMAHVWRTQLRTRRT